MYKIIAKYASGCWEMFLKGFCKVEFVCYQVEPNWLGWIILGFFGLLILWLAFCIVINF